MSKKADLIHQAHQHERAARAELMNRLHHIVVSDADDSVAIERSRATEEVHHRKARQCWSEVEAIAAAEDDREWPPEEPQWLVDMG